MNSRGLLVVTLLESPFKNPSSWADIFPRTASSHLLKGNNSQAADILGARWGRIRWGRISVAVLLGVANSVQAVNRILCPAAPRPIAVLTPENKPLYQGSGKASCPFCTVCVEIRNPAYGNSSPLTALLSLFNDQTPLCTIYWVYSAAAHQLRGFQRSGAPLFSFTWLYAFQRKSPYSHFSGIYRGAN